MNKVFCQIEDEFVDPLFEVFDGGDLILSSYRDIESPLAEVRIFVADAGEVPFARERLTAALSVLEVPAAVETAEVPDEDWKYAYRRHFRTEHVSPRIWTHPPWERMPASGEGEIVVTLDPGLAFGTGKHETTKTCLGYIDELASAGGSLLDMGTGSGILSIAAAKLGFKPVTGFDIDGDAVEAARENAALNAVAVDFRRFALGRGRLSAEAAVECAKGVYPDLAQPLPARQEEDCPPEPADVVVANILGPLLIAFAGEIAGYVRRTLIVSGILNENYPEVRAAFAAQGLVEVSVRPLGEWTTARLERR